MLYIDRHQFQIVELKLANQILQRHGVPHNLIIPGQMGLLHSFLHVVVGYSIIAPAVTNHEVVTETAFMDDNAMVSQIFDLLDFDRVYFLV